MVLGKPDELMPGLSCQIPLLPTVILHVPSGLPLFLFPGGVHFRATWGRIILLMRVTFFGYDKPSAPSSFHLAADIVDVSGKVIYLAVRHHEGEYNNDVK